MLRTIEFKFSCVPNPSELARIRCNCLPSSSVQCASGLRLQSGDEIPNIDVTNGLALVLRREFPSLCQLGEFVHAPHVSVIRTSRQQGIRPHCGTIPRGPFERRWVNIAASVLAAGICELIIFTSYCDLSFLENWRQTRDRMPRPDYQPPSHGRLPEHPQPC